MPKKVLYCSLLMIVLIFGCNNKKSFDLPMEKQKFISLLADVYIAEEMSKANDETIQDSMKGIYMEQVAEIHNLSVDQVNEYLIWLNSFPDSLLTFQNRAIDTIRRIQDASYTSQNLGIKVNN